MNKIALAFGLAYCFQKNANLHQDASLPPTVRNALCILFPQNQSGVTGIVSFQ